MAQKGFPLAENTGIRLFRGWLGLGLAQAATILGYRWFPIP